ncbi:STAS domain-containing protein [Streptomyces sp. NBC_00233]|uniref:STAS domain-containing protein n=1 Tax=Streptomyces sp. NBC_00233 TaxID=2975686 RepID=UPI00225BA3CF|nr:STAS domain-containing protein [Streptomyces sp. NBC_00233]MCX5233113.1 STAS domain-containing protein [Streptomyces sp. NBC_00233]
MRADELLQTRTVWCGDTVLLCLTGELDLATTPLVDQAVTTVLAGHPQILCLDLTGLTFCDRTGLHTLQRVSSTVHAAHTSLRLAGLHPSLHRTLHQLNATPPWPRPALLH